MTKVVRLKSFLGKLNTFLLIEKKIIIIDTGYGCHYKKILGYLERNKISKNQISLIILTHAHLDHYDNANLLKNELNVPVLSSKKASEYFRNGGNEPTMPTNFLAKVIKIRFYHKKITPISPEITIEQKFDLTRFGVDGFVLPTPGHTEGSLSIVINKNECIAGDLYISFIKAGKLAWFINNREEYNKSIEKIKFLNIKRIYPSHGKDFLL
jgi:hydroxyacylglutathione hydrolase